MRKAAWNRLSGRVFLPRSKKLSKILSFLSSVLPKVKSSNHTQKIHNKIRLFVPNGGVQSICNVNYSVYCMKLWLLQLHFKMVMGDILSTHWQAKRKSEWSLPSPRSAFVSGFPGCITTTRTSPTKAARREVDKKYTMVLRAIIPFILAFRLAAPVIRLAITNGRIIN